MDGHENNYSNFSVGSIGNNFLPTVSAFSAYNLLRNCNYLLTTPQTTEKSILSRQIAPKIITSPSSIPDELNEKYKISLRQTPYFKYVPHLNAMLSSSNEPTISPNLYSPILRRHRGEKKPIPDEQKDEKYFEKRRRNNQAAKKSRDARKIREDQIALKATILEHENAILKAQILTLREETTSLRQMLIEKKNSEILSRDSHIL